MKREKLTDKKIKKIRKLYKKGKSYKQIAEKVKVSISTVRKYTKRSD